MPERAQQPVLCSELSEQAHEQLYGTATRVDVWLLLENADPWPAKGFDDSTVPASVKTYLAAQLPTLPHPRIQLIKQRGHASSPMAFYVAVAHETEPRLYEFHLEQYDGILAIDLSAVVNDDGRYTPYLRDEPIYLVCAHTTRDQCCARYGVPVYGELIQHPDLMVWQTSHLGGHRFAANMICLPAGIMFGRVRPGTVRGLIDQLQIGNIELNAYRGRCCYSEEVQAADFYLRQHSDLRDVNAILLYDVHELGPGQWEVGFTSQSDRRIHWVVVTKDQAAIHTITSCKDQQPSGIDQFRFVSYRIVDPARAAS